MTKRIFTLTIFLFAAIIFNQSLSIKFNNIMEKKTLYYQELESNKNLYFEINRDIFLFILKREKIEDEIKLLEEENRVEKSIERIKNIQLKNDIKVLFRDLSVYEGEQLEINLKNIDEKFKIKAKNIYSQNLENYKKIQIFGNILLAIISFLLLLIYRKNCKKEFYEIKDYLKIIKEGHFNIRIEKKGFISAGLAKELNYFVSDLEKIFRNLKSKTEVLLDTSSSIKRSNEDLELSSKQFKDSVNSTSAAIEEMAGTVANIANNAENVAKNMDITALMAGEGKEAVKDVIGEINLINEVVAKGLSGVENLGKMTAKIGDIVTVITDIASQTNLLALNAAIEAARAGEAGRGFEVVAEEVRKLADKTTDATKEISKMIKEIQIKSNSVIIEMGKAKKEVEKGVETADSTGDILEKIVEKVINVKDMIDIIAVAVKEQSLATEEISNQAENINNNAEETSYIIKKNSNEVKENYNAIDEFRNIILKYKTSENSLKLKKHVKESSFKEYINWGNEFLTGIDLIDIEHKELVETVNNLISAIENGQSKLELEEIIEFLLNYTVKHFEDEEKIMLENNYPDYSEQKEAHDEFVNFALNLQKEFKEEGLIPGTAIKIKKYLADWLINHIQKMDKKIGKYLGKIK